MKKTILVLSILSLSRMQAEPENKKLKEAERTKDLISEQAFFREVDWISIKLDNKWASSELRIKGFLSIEEEGGAVTCYLYETRESMRLKRNSYQIELDSEDILNLAKKNFGDGSGNWKVLCGLFVQITGKMKRVERGDEPKLGLGKIDEISAVEIFNNGHMLMGLYREKS